MRGWSSALALLAVAASGAAPLAAQDSPREVATAFFTAVAEERWRDAAGLLDLRTFERFRRDQVQWMRAPTPEPTITVEQLLRHDPGMPREVAEYEVKRIRERSRDVRGQMLEREFANVTSVDTLAALPAAEAAARWLQAQDYRWLWRLARRDAAHRGCPTMPESEGPRAAVREIVGAILADTIGYVLHTDPMFRMRSEDTDLHDPSPVVMHLRRRAGRWLILPRHDVLRAAGTIVTMDCEPIEPAARKPPDDR
jgi:hypothetical protein